MKDTRKTVRAIAALLTLGAAFILCGCHSSASQDRAQASKASFARPGVFVAAALLPKDAPQTPSLQNGMLLAQETVNANGGVLGHPLDIRFFPCGAEDPNGFEALQSALDKHPSVVWVSGDLAVYLGPELIDQHVLSCFLSEYPPVPSLLPLGVRAYPNGPALCQQVFEIAHTTDITSVAILYASGPVNQSLCAYLAFLMQGDGIRVYRDQFSVGEDQFGMLADYLKRSDIDAVYLVGPAAECDRLAAALEKIGYPHPILAVFPQPPDDKKLLSLKARLIYARPTNLPAPAFVEAYRRRFSKTPDLLAAYGYENVMRIAAAANAARSRDPECIRKALLADKAAYVLPGLVFEKDGDTSIELSLHIPSGVKIPPRVPPTETKMMERTDGPILLLDPYEPIKTK